MFEFRGIWHDSVEELREANPTTPIDASVSRDIALSHAWDNNTLPHDAAAILCKSRQSSDYETLARLENNAEFGKSLAIENGRISWVSGTLALRSTKDIRDGSEVLATRGHAFWIARGFP